MEWYLKVLKEYLNFKGRASREEFWMFVLFNTIFLILAMMFDHYFHLNFGRTPFGILYFLYGFAVFLPYLAVSVRRLHDIGKSGWLLLMPFISLFLLAFAIGMNLDILIYTIPTSIIFAAIFMQVVSIYLLVLFAIDGNAGENKYGSNPKLEIDNENPL